MKVSKTSIALLVFQLLIVSTVAPSICISALPARAYGRAPPLTILSC